MVKDPSRKRFSWYKASSLAQNFVTLTKLLTDKITYTSYLKQ